MFPFILRLLSKFCVVENSFITDVLASWESDLAKLADMQMFIIVEGMDLQTLTPCKSTSET